MAKMKFWSIPEIRSENSFKGFHFFDDKTMKFFGSRVSDEVFQGPNGIFIVTSEKDFSGHRTYAVREFKPETGNIVNAGDRMATLRQAKETARRLCDVATPEQWDTWIDQMEHVHGNHYITTALKLRKEKYLAKHNG